MPLSIYCARHRVFLPGVFQFTMERETVMIDGCVSALTALTLAGSFRMEKQKDGCRLKKENGYGYLGL